MVGAIGASFDEERTEPGAVFRTLLPEFCLFGNPSLCRWKRLSRTLLVTPFDVPGATEA